MAEIINSGLAHLIQKINKAIPKVKQVGKDKKGYNFTYSDSNSIRKSVNDAISGLNLFIDAPRWDVSKGYTVEKDGKNFLIKGWVLIDIIDAETGFKKTYGFPGAQTATDPMQAVNSAESYNLRPLLREVFSVEIEKDDMDVSKRIRVFDKDENSVDALSSIEVNGVVEALSTGPAFDPAEVKNYVGELLKKYNTKFETNYPRLSLFPTSEYKELLEYAMAYAHKIA